MNLVNLTKKPLTLRDTNGEAVDILPDPRHIGIAGMGEHRAVEDGNGHTFSLNVRHVREIEAMPEPQEGTLYIVPVEFAMILQLQRDDVVFPADETQVRDGDGRMRSVTHLRRVVSGVRDRRDGEATRANSPSTANG